MTGRNQFFPPLYLPDLEAERGLPLTRVPFAIGGGDEFNEDWLQERLFRHPEILPLAAFDALAAPAVPLCRELPTAAGPADLVYMSGAGRLTIVECKLWRNPEARRTVVAQVLDYAKEIARWNYEDLEAAVRRSAGDTKSIADRVRTRQPDLDEAALHDEVQANLSRGRFNMLIVGDGIREGVRQLVEYLTRDLTLGYRFGLVELAVYRMPEGAPPGFILQPRLLAQTTAIERVVVFGGADAAATAVRAAPPGEEMTPEEQIRATIQQADPGLLPLLDKFFGDVVALGVKATVLQSFTLHWPFEGLGNINFGSIFRDGTIATQYICDSARRAGDIAIGERYLEGVSALIPGSEVRRKGEPWTWKVVVGRNLPKVRLLLEKETQWRAIIAEVQDRFRKILPLGG
jgi:hypothetical protein